MGWRRPHVILKMSPLFIGVVLGHLAWPGEAQPTKLNKWAIATCRVRAKAQSEVDTWVVMSALRGFQGRQRSKYSMNRVLSRMCPNCAQSHGSGSD